MGTIVKTSAIVATADGREVVYASLTPKGVWELALPDDFRRSGDLSAAVNKALAALPGLQSGERDWALPKGLTADDVQAVVALVAAAVDAHNDAVAKARANAVEAIVGALRRGSQPELPLGDPEPVKRVASQLLAAVNLGKPPEWYSTLHCDMPEGVSRPVCKVPMGEHTMALMQDIGHEVQVLCPEGGRYVYSADLFAGLR